jgi:hypothetical protein
MSRLHPHYFPADTPEPTALPCSAIDELMQLVQVWLVVSAVLVVGAGLLAFFFPDLLLSIFR